MCLELDARIELVFLAWRARTLTIVLIEQINIPFFKVVGRDGFEPPCLSKMIYSHPESATVPPAHFFGSDQGLFALRCEHSFHHAAYILWAIWATGMFYNILPPAQCWVILGIICIFSAFSIRPITFLYRSLSRTKFSIGHF